jgi:NAD(P)-dependent dehydrogenase (short-subunit alcohol dehydrogenase family)
MERFADRVAVITGGAGGIGRASAVRLASEGATVVIVDTNEQAGKALADELGGLYLAADVTSPEDNARIYEQTQATYGRIDVAFHNAGISPPDDDSILDTGLEAWKRVQDVNLTSVFLGCKAVLPYMLRVNALSPGPVATPMLMELFAHDPERAERRLVHVPLGRFAEPSEIAAAVAFLGSDDASFITASNFLVDGGLTGAYVTPL